MSGRDVAECRGCGGVIVRTVFGFGHVTNPGYKHHVPTPRRAQDSSPALLGVPDSLSTSARGQLNRSLSVPQPEAVSASQGNTGTPLRPPNGGVAARADRPPRSAPDASVGRSTAS